MTDSGWRGSRPGAWLVAALLAELATYVTSAGLWTGAVPWVLLDAWLAYRTWKGGRVALNCFRALQVGAVVLYGVVLVLSRVTSAVDTDATPVSILLWGVSAWCLLAPALSRHVRTTPGAPVPS